MNILWHLGHTYRQVLLNEGRPDGKSTAFNVEDLPTFLRWLFGETGRPEADYAHECMELFSALVKVPPGTRTTGRFVRSVPSRATDQVRASSAGCWALPTDAAKTPAEWVCQAFATETSPDAVLHLYRPLPSTISTLADPAIAPALQREAAYRDLCRCLVRGQQRNRWRAGDRPLTVPPLSIPHGGRPWSQDGCTWVLGEHILPASAVLDGRLPLLGQLATFLRGLVHQSPIDSDRMAEDRADRPPLAERRIDLPADTLAMQRAQCTAVVRVVCA